MGLRNVTVDESTRIGGGISGAVYRISEDKILKVYAEGFPEEEVRRLYRVSECLNTNGIHTARTYEVVKAGNALGIIQEYIDGKPLVHLIAERVEKRNDAAEKMGELLKRVHALPADPEIFMPLSRMFGGLLDRCGDLLTDDQKKRAAETVAAFPGKDTVLHGDFHENNILVRDGEYYLIDLDSMCIGSPLFEFMQFFCIYENEVPQEVQDMADMRPEALKTFRSVFLKTYFGKDDAFVNEYAESLSTLGNLNRLLGMCLQAELIGREKVRVHIDEEFDRILEEADKAAKRCGSLA